MKIQSVTFVAGLLFAVGLALAGMGQSSTVVGFLDIAGHWNPRGDPVVMAGHFVSKRLAKPLSPSVSPL